MLDAVTHIRCVPTNAPEGLQDYFSTNNTRRKIGFSPRVYFSFGADWARANEFAATTTPSRPAATDVETDVGRFRVVIAANLFARRNLPQSEMYPSPQVVHVIAEHRDYFSMTSMLSMAHVSKHRVFHRKWFMSLRAPQGRSNLQFARWGLLRAKTALAMTG